MRRLRRALALLVAVATGYAIRRPAHLAPPVGGLYTVEAVELLRARSFDVGLAEGRARAIADAVGMVDRAAGQLDKNREDVWAQGYAAGADEALAELYPESHAARAAIERMIVERRRPRTPGY